MQRETREQETQNERSQQAKATRTGLAYLPALARAMNASVDPQVDPLEKRQR